MELDANGVKTEFLEDPVKLDLIGRNGHAIGPKCRYDFRCSNTTVKVTFFVRVGFHIDRLLADLIGQGSQGNEALLLDRRNLLFMLLNHPLVMLVRDDRKTFRQQVIVGVPRFDFNDLPCFAKVLNILDEHQLDATIGPLRKPWVLRGSLFRGGFGWSCHDRFKDAGRSRYLCSNFDLCSNFAARVRSPPIALDCISMHPPVKGPRVIAIK